MRSQRSPDGFGGLRSGILGAVGSKIIKIITVLIFRLVRAGAEWVGQEFGRQIESRFKKHALVRFAPNRYADPKPQPLTDTGVGALSGGQALLFVHDTFSSAYGAFHGSRHTC